MYHYELTSYLCWFIVSLISFKKHHHAPFHVILLFLSHIPCTSELALIGWLNHGYDTNAHPYYIYRMIFVLQRTQVCIFISVVQWRFCSPLKVLMYMGFYELLLNWNDWEYKMVINFWRVKYCCNWSCDTWESRNAQILQGTVLFLSDMQGPSLSPLFIKDSILYWQEIMLPHQIDLPDHNENLMRFSMFLPEY